MSVHYLLLDQHKPNLNIRVNNLTADTSINSPEILINNQQLFANGRTLSSKIENITVATNGTLNLLNVSGSGFITAIQFAPIASPDSEQALLDSTFTFTIDNITPQTCDFGSFGMIHQFPTPFQTNTINIQGNNGISSWGASRKVFIPFNFNANISITNISSSSTLRIYAQVYYILNDSTSTIPYLLSNTRRKIWRCNLLKNISVPALGSVNLLSVSGTSGQIESVFLLFYSSNSLGSLEGNVQYTIDGVPNAYEAGGTEDYFGGQFYWDGDGNGPNFLRSDRYGLLVQYTVSSGLHNVPICNSAYRFHLDDDPINFNSSLTLTWNNGQAGEGTPPTTPCTIISLVTYWTTS